MELTKGMYLNSFFLKVFFEWFDLKKAARTNRLSTPTFEEKDLPPLLATDKIKELLPENSTKLPLSIFRERKTNPADF